MNSFGLAFRTITIFSLYQGRCCTSDTQMDKTLHEMVIKAAALYKNRNAVCFQMHEGSPVFCNYAEMLQRAEDLTCFLQSLLHGLPKCVIGLYCQPSIHLLSWILGILQVPAAYCPIDPGSPSNFISSLTDLCRIRLMLVENSKTKVFRQLFPNWIERDSSRVQHLDITIFEAVQIEKINDIDAKVKNDHDQTASALHPTVIRHPSDEFLEKDRISLAYVLHTSGTTGKPKIVSVPHCCIVPNIQHLSSIFAMSPKDLLFLASPLSFDPSVIEMFLALSSGACLLIVPEHLKMMPRNLFRVLFQQHRVTVLQVTPTLLRRFSCDSIQSSVLSKETSLRVLALGGEQFPPVSMLRRWKEPGNRTRLFNLYGITEVSSWATCYEIPESLLNSHAGDSPIPLGRPLWGTILEVRNEDNEMIEEGEGQVFLGGKQRVCFLDDEFILPSGTMRSTGDWVRLQNGDMYYIGRRDNQFKLHGKRLNTEYIQQVIEKLEQVEACAVMWSNNEHLILFIVPRGSVDRKALWRAVKSNLLSYAVPDDLILLDTLPLTNHGKLDYSSLRLLYGDHLKEKKSKPESQTRLDFWKSLHAMWKTSLGFPEDVPDVVEDSMFLLSGGDSLKAIRFQEDVEALVGKPVPGLLEVIFNDTIMAVGKHVIRSIFPEKDEGKARIHETEGCYGTVDISTKNDRKRKADYRSSSPAGCYDGGVYILRRNDGATHWIFSTGDSVKSSPAIDPMCDLVYVGSHDQHLYALNIEEKQCVWKCHCQASAVFSSPCINMDPHHLYAATLRGLVLAINPSTGKRLWKTDIGKPVFSTLHCSDKHVFFGCVDAMFYCLSHWGEKLWQFSTEGPIFSSPCVSTVSKQVMFGSHDGFIYCCSTKGELLWKYKTSSRVYATPFVFPNPHTENTELLAAASTDGSLWILDAHSGLLISQCTLEGEIFSSPVVCLNQLVVGCRDNYVYCFDLNSKINSHDC
ncbi:beta-alanine-activating enzyme isoform X3 [Pyxicephalus adspersus]|uniref:beta-alanine-activating enzyme isoform X3 n=1 Tax=Pyxicephalus adspersus TaxID=30357 RepID=UPI003B5AA591